jgi:hypothetical protein
VTVNSRPPSDWATCTSVSDPMPSARAGGTPTSVITASMPIKNASVTGENPRVGRAVVAEFTTSCLAHGCEEGAHVVDEQLGLFERGEVTAARHRRPVRDVVRRLTPAARCAKDLVGERRDSGRQRDRFAASLYPRLTSMISRHVEGELVEVALPVGIGLVMTWMRRCSARGSVPTTPARTPTTDPTTL